MILMVVACGQLTQLVECHLDVVKVGGSSPSLPTKMVWYNKPGFIFLYRNDSMLLCEDWQDYRLLDSGNGEKLEKWGPYILRRPDPQAVWPFDNHDQKWDRVDAFYHRSDSGGGYWEKYGAMPETWIICYRNLRLNVQLMQFKHTGVFPEQAVNWNWITERISEESKRKLEKGVNERIKVLNLFAYTGAATVAAALAGAEVCHVDAAKGIVAKAKENTVCSEVPYERTRYIVDDVLKFVKREIKRNKKYDAVIMDPPTYGRGPGGELWKIESQLYDLVNECRSLLTKRPLFFLINSYSSTLSATVIENILSLTVKNEFGGRTVSDEIGLKSERKGIVLPCGCCGRWEMH